MSEGPAKPRRFRFSLRVLLALVTAVGIACGWVISERNIVREREKCFRDAALPKVSHGVLGMTHSKTHQISWLRRLMGDRPLAAISIDIRFPDEAVERIRRAYPEATIMRFNGTPETPISENLGLD